MQGLGPRFTLLKLGLEKAVLAYYLYIGRMDSVESKICKLYVTVQQILDPSHCVSCQSNYHRVCKLYMTVQQILLACHCVSSQLK
jgi:hypothetical protein